MPSRGRPRPAHPDDRVPPRHAVVAHSEPPSALRELLAGGDRRSIARSNEVRPLLDADPTRVAELVALTEDTEWLVQQRALDLLEKLAFDHNDWVAPHQRVFIGPLADSDKWEIRLQIVRALPLFKWTAAERKRVEAILVENVDYPQTFVRAWALDSLAVFAESNAQLMAQVKRKLSEFERSTSKALQARARKIKERLSQRTKTGR